MWPTDITPVLLVVGLVPLILSTSGALRHGLQGLYGLELAGVAFLWLGYHASPWLALRPGAVWDDFLLLPSHIDTSLLFSAACMSCLILGARMAAKSRESPQASSATRPQLPVWVLIVLCLASAVLFVVHVGGPSEAWSSSHSRGAGQFDVRDAYGKVAQVLGVMQAVVSVLLMTAASYHSAQAPLLSRRYLAGLALILIASLRYLWFFSRAAGAGFVILAVATIAVRRRGGAKLAFLYLLFAVYLGNIGLSSRDQYQPGIGTFLEATITRQESHRAASVVPEPYENGLDATSAFTRKIDALTDGPILELVGTFFWNLNPVPSELVAPEPVGDDLTDVMGTTGSARITTPAMAELYYVFGYTGCAFFVLLGAVYGWIYGRFRERRGLAYYFCGILCLVSFPIGLHSSTRAMTRPVLYALLIAIVANKVHDLKRRTRLDQLAVG